MLFLFNDVVFDVGEPRETALSAGAPVGPVELVRLSVAQTVKLVRETVFDEPDIARGRPDRARFLAALIAWKTGEANAALAVRPTAARSPLDVQVRLASVNLVTLAQLRELQAAERLTPAAVNNAVWDHAPQRMQA